MDPQVWRSQLADLENQIDSNEKRLSTSRTPRDKRNIKAKLPQLNDLFESLDNQLTTYHKNPGQYGFNNSETGQLLTKMSQLRTKLSSLDASCNKADDSRSALLGDARYRNVKDSEQTIDMTNQQLFADHQARQAGEEAQLDNISDGLTQLNQIASQQNQHLVHHNAQIGQLNDTIDVVDENMRHNIKRVDLVEENSRGGWVSVTFILLLLVLIFMNLFTCWFVIFYPGGKCP